MTSSSCPECGKEFNSTRAVKTHQGEIHRRIEKKAKEKKPIKPFYPQPRRQGPEE